MTSVTVDCRVYLGWRNLNRTTHMHMDLTSERRMYDKTEAGIKHHSRPTLLSHALLLPTDRGYPEAPRV